MTAGLKMSRLVRLHWVFKFVQVGPIENHDLVHHWEYAFMAMCSEFDHWPTIKRVNLSDLSPFQVDVCTALLPLSASPPTGPPLTPH